MLTKLLKQAAEEAKAFAVGRLDALTKDLAATVELFRLQTSVWMVRVEANTLNRSAIDGLLEARAALLLQVASLAPARPSGADAASRRAGRATGERDIGALPGRHRARRASRPRAHDVAVLRAHSAHRAASGRRRAASLVRSLNRGAACRRSR